MKQYATGLDVTLSNAGIRTIRMNRPERKNALTMSMFDGIVDALNDADADAATKFVVLTGAGDFFSSGNDLTNFMNAEGKDTDEMISTEVERFRKFVAAFIDFKKLIIALVNGPAVGIMVTILGLCDVVYVTDDATFVTPFSKLGQSPEGCSTYIFPRLMNRGKAMEMMCFNKKVSAVEAEAMGLVTRVFPRTRFETETDALLRNYATLPLGSLNAAKKLVRFSEAEELHRVNLAEVEELKARVKSDDCFNAIMSFFQTRAKL